MSKKIVESATGTFTATEAVFGDVFTTLISTETSLNGTMGLLQKAGLFVAGMATQNYRLGRGINPFQA